MQPREESQKKVRLRSVTQLALIAGPFLSMVDSSVVNVAIPAIATSFHSSLASVQWILTGYLLSLAAVLSASAYLSKRFGAKKVYFWSIAGFTAASFCAALSPNLDLLIVARMIQGGLGAPMVPVAMDLLFGGPSGQSGESDRADLSLVRNSALSSSCNRSESGRLPYQLRRLAKHLSDQRSNWYLFCSAIDQNSHA